MKTGISVPSGVSGYLARLGELSFCMDGATHLIHTTTGATRLKARNKMAGGLLDRYDDGKTMVTVMGVTIWAGECMHLSVYSVEETNTVMELAGPIDHLPW